MSTIKERLDRLEATTGPQTNHIIIIRPIVTPGQADTEIVRAQFGGQTYVRQADESQSDFIERVKAIKGVRPGAILVFADVGNDRSALLGNGGFGRS